MIEQLDWHVYVTIAVVVFGTVLTRVASFVLFANHAKPPAVIQYLGDVLPGAVMGLLVVYSLKNVAIMTYPYGLPEAISLIALVSVHVYKRNLLVSIAVGTILYMVLVQTLFS